jgi:hypothetical protein
MKCPTCAHDLDEVSMDMLAEMRALTGLEKRTISVLISAYPRALTPDQMVDMLYPGGTGPDYEIGVLRTVLSRIRTKIGPMGWTVSKGRTGPGHERMIYRLEPLQ